MPKDEILMNLKFAVKGTEVVAAISSFTPETVRVKIDASSPWDADALRCLSVALDAVAKVLPLKQR